VYLIQSDNQLKMNRNYYHLGAFTNPSFKFVEFKSSFNVLKLPGHGTSPKRTMLLSITDALTEIRISVFFVVDVFSSSRFLSEFKDM